MDQNQMIDDLIKMLDSGMANGVGHMNVDVDESSAESKNVETMGCVDCNKNSMSCAIPTLHDGVHDLD